MFVCLYALMNLRAVCLVSSCVFSVCSFVNLSASEARWHSRGFRQVLMHLEAFASMCEHLAAFGSICNHSKAYRAFACI